MPEEVQCPTLQSSNREVLVHDPDRDLGSYSSAFTIHRIAISRFRSENHTIRDADRDPDRDPTTRIAIHTEKANYLQKKKAKA